MQLRNLDGTRRDLRYNATRGGGLSSSESEWPATPAEGLSGSQSRAGMWDGCGRREGRGRRVCRFGGDAPAASLPTGHCADCRHGAQSASDQPESPSSTGVSESQQRFWPRAPCHARLCDRLTMRASPLTGHCAGGRRGASSAFAELLTVHSLASAATLSINSAEPFNPPPRLQDFSSPGPYRPRVTRSGWNSILP